MAESAGTQRRRGNAGPADRLQAVLEGATGPALFFAAHPDDIEVHAAALVLELQGRGVAVRYVLATSGDRGAPDGQTSREEVAALRETEQRAAAAQLGVRELRFLRLADGELRFREPALLEALTREIRRSRPRLVAAPDPFMSARNLDPCVLSTDHIACGAMALQAAFVAAPSPLYYPEQVARGFAPWTTPVLLFYMTDYPDLFIDATPHWDVKVRAVQAHVSQTACGDGLLTVYERGARDTGRRAGLARAEGFKVLRRTC